LFISFNFHIYLLWVLVFLSLIKANKVILLSFYIKFAKFVLNYTQPNSI